MEVNVIDSINLCYEQQYSINRKFIDEEICKNKKYEDLNELLEMDKAIYNSFQGKTVFFKIYKWLADNKKLYNLIKLLDVLNYKEVLTNWDNQQNNDKIWYAIMGAFGTGKTTLLRRINEILGYPCSSNNDIIREGTTLNKYHKKLFVDNEHDYFFRFQMNVLPLRFLQSQECQPNSFVDETIFDALTYTKAIKNLEWMKNEEYSTFMDNFEIMQKYLVKPKKIIYLSCDDIYTILKRLKRRGRIIEKKFTIEYIEALLMGFDEVYEELKYGYDIEKFDIEDFEDDDGMGLYNEVVKKLCLISQKTIVNEKKWEK